MPFGAGGSYTTFEWSDIRLSSTTVDSNEGVTVELTIENTGSRPGSEVVQIYVAPPAATPLFRPARELKGFTKIHLEPSERRSVVVELDWRAFAYWTPEDRATAFHDQVRQPLSRPPCRTVSPSGWTVIDGNYLIVVRDQSRTWSPSCHDESRARSRAVDRPPRGRRLAKHRRARIRTESRDLHVHVVEGWSTN